MVRNKRTARQILLDNGYEDVVIFENESYDSALIGVTEDNRAVYSYKKMVQWCMEKNNCSEEDAMEWIDYNTIRSLPYAGEKSPIVVFDLHD